MKKKQKKEKKNLPANKKAPPLSFFEQKETGKFKGESTVVYSLTLPDLAKEEFQESRLFFEKIKENFLSFLEKESQKKQEGVNLGTLSFQTKDHTLTLYSSYTPFEQKEEKAVAKIFFSPKGNITKISSL